MTDSELRQIYISRDVSNETYVSKLLSRGYSLFAFSALRFEQIPVDGLPETEWFFFYSQRGVRFFVEQLTPLERQKLASKRLACIGPQTDDAIKQQLGRKCDFFLMQHSDQEILDVRREIGNATVCFIQALDSKRTIQSDWETGDYIELATYKNEIDPEAVIPDCKYVMLTSSKNTHAYFLQHRENSDKIFIAIGLSTKSTILEYVAEEQIRLATRPSESALFQCLYDELQLG